MEKTIDKELISHILKLEKRQQGEVLSYIKNMLASDEMNIRADNSEQSIESGEVKSLDQFSTDFEHWKSQKRASMK